MCCCCSWYIFPHLGETVRWHPWIQTSLTVTASQPVALTVKHATWWTTATVAWCTCLVGNHSYRMLSRSYINDSPEINECTHFKYQESKKIYLCVMWVCFALAAGDAPYCTPELYKECADPALGEKESSSMSGLNLCGTGRPLTQLRWSVSKVRLSSGFLPPRFPGGERQWFLCVWDAVQHDQIQQRAVFCQNPQQGLR